MKALLIRRFGYLAVLIACLAPAQETFKSTVTEVEIPVTVTTPQHKYMVDLKQEDFKIFDNTVEQKITYFNRERDQPIVVGFLVDLSNATKSQWKDIQQAEIDLIDTLLPGDKKYSGFLIGYTTQPDLMVDTTSDPEKMVEKLRKAKPGGGAALYDAIWMAFTSRKLVAGEPFDPRRVLVIVGDGHDNASNKTLAEVIEKAQRESVTIFGVNTSSYGFGNDDDDYVLNKLTDATGGKVEYPLQHVFHDISGYLEVPTDGGNYQYALGTGGYKTALATNIATAIAHITGEITTQYILRYAPDLSLSSTNRHDLKVTVDVPGLQVRARQSYYPYSATEANPHTR